MSLTSQKNLLGVYLANLIFFLETNSSPEERDTRDEYVLNIIYTLVISFDHIILSETNGLVTFNIIMSETPLILKFSFLILFKFQT